MAARRSSQSSSGLPAPPKEVGDSGRQWSCALASAGKARRRRAGRAALGVIAEIRPFSAVMSTGPSLSRPRIDTPASKVIGSSLCRVLLMQETGRRSARLARRVLSKPPIPEPSLNLNFLAYAALAIGVGALFPIQSAANALLGRDIGGPIAATLVSFASGLILLLAINTLLFRQWPSLAQVGAQPWPLWA